MQKYQASKLFNALSDESRVIILKTLYHQKEMYASELLQLVDCGQSTLSYHMSILYEANLVSANKKTRKVYYSCNKPLVNELMEYIKK